tara:strand:+ start:693 stop:914 length:222 start_codon:yes stop_codon:yes gene_type:complete
VNINTQKKYRISFTEDEMDFIANMLQDEANKAREYTKYAKRWECDYAFKDELKSVWKKVIKAAKFPYSLKAKY